MCYCKQPTKPGWTHDETVCWLTAAFPSFKPSVEGARVDLVQSLPDGDLLIGREGQGYGRLSEELSGKGVGPAKGNCGCAYSFRCKLHDQSAEGGKQDAD